MKDGNEYIIFKNWISAILEDAKNGKNVNINKIIKKASRLPSPDTEEKYNSLIDSGLCYCFDELAFSLNSLPIKDTNAIKKKNFKRDKKKILTTYLSELWKIFEKNILKYGWEKYFDRLSNSVDYQKRVSAVESIYHRITHPGNECYNPACENTNGILKSTEFYFKHSSEFLKLSRTSILGCEGFVDACHRLNNEIVFVKIWNHWKAPIICKTQLLWLPFIICAGQLKRADILNEIWSSFIKNFKKVHFYIIIFLLYSAKKAKVNSIIEYFKNLNTPSYWDLSTYYNPYLDQLLSAFSSDQKEDSFLRLEYRSFEGNFWNLYLKQNTEQSKKEADEDELYSKFKTILRFRREYPNDWNSTFCLAQETYARELRFRLYSELQNQFSYLENLNTDEFVKEIETQQISRRIKNYQENVSQLLSQPSYISEKDERLENKFLPFIDYILSNHISFLRDRNYFHRWQNDTKVKSSFFKKVENLYKNISPENITDQEWRYFLDLLVMKIKQNVNLYFSELFLAELHSMKRTFAKKFENNFQKSNVVYIDSHELITKANKFIKNISIQIPRYRITEPKEVDIIPGIEKYLLKEYKGTEEDFYPCCLSFDIAGYDGIYEDYLVPIFIEIRSNAEKALSQIPEEKRQYQVNLKYGKNDYSGYGMFNPSSH